MGRGSGSSKKESQSVAAVDALARLGYGQDGKRLAADHADHEEDPCT